jgi:hypothetical protein
MSGHPILASSTAVSASLSAHFWHGVEALGFLVFALGAGVISDRRQARRESPAEPARQLAGQEASPTPAAATTMTIRHAPLLPAIALGGAGAAAVHFVVMPDHFEESALYGAFFLVAAIVQLGYSALLLARPSRTLVAAGVAGNLAVILLWVVTRTISIPLGPGAGTTEAFGGLDILASAFEALVVICGTVTLVHKPTATPRLRAPAWSALTVLAAGAVTVTTYFSPPS